MKQYLFVIFMVASLILVYNYVQVVNIDGKVNNNNNCAVRKTKIEGENESHLLLWKTFLKRRAVVEPLNMGEILSSCKDTRIKKENKPLTLEEFICEFNCTEQEPELEFTVRNLHLAQHHPKQIIDMCVVDNYVPYVIWMDEKNTIRYYSCMQVPGYYSLPNKMPGTFRIFLRFLYLLKKTTELPELVVGFEPNDFVIPMNVADRYSFLRYVPPILRFVGTNAHVNLLIPTWVVLTHYVHCNIGNFNDSSSNSDQEITIENKEEWWKICGKQRASSVSFRDKTSRVIHWRGNDNSKYFDDPYYTWRNEQRAKLIREFHGKSGFDVAFSRPPKTWAMQSLKNIGHDPSLYTAKKMIEEWKHDHYIKFYKAMDTFRFFLHVDGETASFGLAQKLFYGNIIVLWVQSSRNYREYWYHYLKPWVHFIPVAPDLSDLDSIKEFISLKENEYILENILKNVKDLIHQHLNRQGIYCYLYRLLFSIKTSQNITLIPGYDGKTLTELIKQQTQLEKWTTVDFSK